MATYLLKKSYQLKDLRKVDYKDLWGQHGIFTTMWIFGNPPKILFFDIHIKNLLRSLKNYGIYKTSLKKNIIEIIKKNLSKKKNYNHLLRIALTKSFLSISLRKRLKLNSNFNLKLMKLKRKKPKYKNLDYKKILSEMSKINTFNSDIGLTFKNKILETGTANIFFVKDGKVFSPKKNFYEGTTFKFFEKKIKRIIRKDILVKDLKDYDEIILVGTGKGVLSVKTIKQANWKRKKMKTFKVFLKLYLKAIKDNNSFIF